MDGNLFITWLLRSPLHDMLSKGMMLITVTGRKTGKRYTIPVGYYEEGGVLWVITKRNRKWWKNLQGGANIELLLRRKPTRGVADIEAEEPFVAARLAEYLLHVPQSAKPLGIRMEGGKPNAADAAHFARERLFIKIKLLEQ